MSLELVTPALAFYPVALRGRGKYVGFLDFIPQRGRRVSLIPFLRAIGNSPVSPSKGVALLTNQPHANRIGTCSGHSHERRRGVCTAARGASLTLQNLDSCRNSVKPRTRVAGGPVK
jgi:hypothetical protein